MKEVWLVFRRPQHRNTEAYVAGAWDNRESAKAQAADLRKLSSTEDARVEKHVVENKYEGLKR